MANTLLSWRGAVEPAEISPSGNEIKAWKGAVEPVGAASVRLNVARKRRLRLKVCVDW